MLDSILSTFSALCFLAAALSFAIAVSCAVYVMFLDRDSPLLRHLTYVHLAAAPIWALLGWLL